MHKIHAAKAITLLLLGSFLGAGFAFVTQVILARLLGPADLGVFAAALATVTLLTPLAGFGVAQFWLKAFGAEGWGAIRWLKTSIRFVTISSVAAFALLIIWSFISPNDDESRFVLLILSFYMLGQVSVELVSAKFQLEEKYIYLSLWQLLPHFLRLLLVFIMVYFVTDPIQVHTVAYLYTSVSIASVVAGLYALINMQSGNFSLKGHAQTTSAYENNSKENPSVTDVIAESWPFGLAGFFQLIYFQSGVILVKYIAGEDAAGLYNVAFTVVAAMYLLPGVIYQKFLLPKLHRWSNHNRERFYQVYRQGNRVMLLLGTLIMIGLWATSNWMIPFLFGDDYADSVFLLNTLAISVPIMFIAFNAGATLVTQNHMRKKVQFMAVAAILNIMFNLIMIPIYGAIGAAVASVLSNAVLACCFYYASKKFVFSDQNIVV